MWLCTTYDINLILQPLSRFLASASQENASREDFLKDLIRRGPNPWTNRSRRVHGHLYNPLRHRYTTVISVYYPSPTRGRHGFNDFINTLKHNNIISCCTVYTRNEARTCIVCTSSWPGVYIYTRYCYYYIMRSVFLYTHRHTHTYLHPRAL